MATPDTNEFKRLKQHVFSWLDAHPAGTYGQYKRMHKKQGTKIHTSTWYGYRKQWMDLDKAIKKSVGFDPNKAPEPMRRAKENAKKLNTEVKEFRKAKNLEDELEYYKWKSYGYEVGYIPRLLEEIKNH